MKNIVSYSLWHSPFKHSIVTLLRTILGYQGAETGGTGKSELMGDEKNDEERLERGGESPIFCHPFQSFPRPSPPRSLRMLTNILHI